MNVHEYACIVHPIKVEASRTWSFYLLRILCNYL